MQPLLWGLLAYVLLPVWLLAGLADYLTHARTHIGRTSGVHESALHLLQTAEIGVPILVLLFLQVGPAALGVMILGALAHTFTAYRDIRYTAPLRHISPFEQLVHAFLIVLPLAGLAIVIVLHWGAFAALLGVTDAPRAVWTLGWRDPSFDAGAIATILGAAFVFAIVPGLLEFIRAWKQARCMAGSTDAHVDADEHPRARGRHQTRRS